MAEGKLWMNTGKAPGSSGTEIGSEFKLGKLLTMAVLVTERWRYWLLEGPVLGLLLSFVFLLAQKTRPPVAVLLVGKLWAPMSSEG